MHQLSLMVILENLFCIIIMQTQILHITRKSIHALMGYKIYFETVVMQYLNSFCSFDLNNVTLNDLTKLSQNRRKIGCMGKTLHIKGIGKEETK
jgi:hypothetical protein